MFKLLGLKVRFQNLVCYLSIKSDKHDQASRYPIH